MARSYWCTADGVAGGRVTASAYMQLSPTGSSWARGCWHGGFLEPFVGVVSHPSASASVDRCYARDAYVPCGADGPMPSGTLYAAEWTRVPSCSRAPCLLHLLLRSRDDDVGGLLVAPRSQVNHVRVGV